jgi:hypothetical protein
MSDTLDIATPRNLLVDGRNPFADEVITVSDPTILSVAAPAADGTVSVTGLLAGTATISVAPGSEDGTETAGSDDITVTGTVVTPPTALSVTLA